MWCPACAALAPPLPSHIPTTFSDAGAYTSTFEPLLHEEARECARSAYQEARNAGKGWAAAVSRWARARGAGLKCGPGCGSVRVRAPSQATVRHRSPLCAIAAQCAPPQPTVRWKPP
jgi:hypothetical protein